MMTTDHKAFDKALELLREAHPTVGEGHKYCSSYGFVGADGETSKVYHGSVCHGGMSFKVYGQPDLKPVYMFYANGGGNKAIWDWMVGPTSPWRSIKLEFTEFNLGVIVSTEYPTNQLMNYMTALRSVCEHVEQFSFWDLLIAYGYPPEFCYWLCGIICEKGKYNGNNNHWPLDDLSPSFFAGEMIKGINVTTGKTAESSAFMSSGNSVYRPCNVVWGPYKNYMCLSGNYPDPMTLPKLFGKGTNPANKKILSKWCLDIAEKEWAHYEKINAPAPTPTATPGTTRPIPKTKQNQPIYHVA